MPGRRAFFVKPSRRSAFGLPPSTIHSTTAPSGPLTSRWIHEWGLTHSIIVTVPRNATGLLTLNSDPKAWCAGTGVAASTRPKTAIAMDSLVRIGDVSLLRVFVVGGTRTFEVVRHAVIGLMTRVLVDRSLVLCQR